MPEAGVIGLGNMGLGMAGSLLRAGIPVTGFDLRAERLGLLTDLGGATAASSQEVGAGSDLVFVMVLDGAQLMAVLTGPHGLLAGLAVGGTVAVSATIKPAEVRQAADLCAEHNVHLLDCPVSGGQPGAAAGTLAMMVAGPAEVLAQNQQFFDAVGGKVIHVSSEVGQGQTVKAALQALIGVTFAGVLEALVLGSKAGISGEVMQDVIGASHVSSPLIQGCIDQVRARAFIDTGSHISTLHKDLRLTMDLAHESGVSLFTTAAALELFQASMNTYPAEDNWAAVKVLEFMAGTEVH